jgi:Right handed beta helix region
VQKALNTLQAGQVAYVRAGSYSQNLMLSRAGTANAPFTVRNYPGERPVLQAGSGQSDNMPLQLGNGAAYVRFQGLVFEGATGPSTTNVYAWGNAHDIELSSCEVTGSQRQGFFSEASTSSIQILGCNIHDNGGSGPTQLDHNVYMQGHGHVIANCRIANAPNGFDVQIYPSSDHIIVTENTIVGAFRDGIIVGSDGGGTTSNLTIVNNVIAFNGRYGISTYWGGTVGTSNVATMNVVWGNGAGQLVGNGITYTANTIADPRFVDRTGGNFHLQAGSPAIDGGQIEYALPDDLDGAARPQGTGPDIGTYER